MRNQSADAPLTNTEAAGVDTDRRLLEQFVRERDQAAFAALIRRHGPLVRGVCGRVLQHAQDAEDAFQATFLVLVRKAATLDLEQPLAGWLYTVAYQVALDARRSAAARVQREKQHAMNGPTIDPAAAAVQKELGQVLDRELSSVPEKYRLPVILCYLQGLSHEEAAKQLGCTAGAIKVQLARARDMLRDRLARRGLAVSAALLAAQLAEPAQAAAIEPGVVDATLQIAVSYAEGDIPTGPGARAADLADGVLEMMKAKSLPQPSKPAPGKKPAQPRGGGQSPSAGPAGMSLAAKALGFVGLAVLVALAMIVIKLVDSSGKKNPAADPALANLRTLQRQWWDAENLANRSADPAGTLARLQEKQREWWARETLIRKGDDPAGSQTLARLEEMQHAWWEREGLARGQQPSDPAGALDRLNAINERWWDGEGIARAEPGVSAEPNVEAPEAVLLDLDVELLDKQGTRHFLEAGGTRESEEAVQFGLQWLAAQQQADGRWLIGKNPGSNNWTNRSSDITTTALALLPFLARGETHKGTSENHQYSKPVENGLRFLLSQQKPDGSLMGTTTGMYTHALATIALCEAFNMTADPLLREPCQKAVDYIIRSQSRVYGGWRYTGPGQSDSDLSVTSWVLMALKSAQLAGLQIPRETLEKAAGFLQKLETPDGGSRYQVREIGGHTVPYPATMNAIGILCRQYLQNLSGSAADDPRAGPMTRGLDTLLANPPAIHEGQRGLCYPVVRRERYTNYYYWYYATYVMANAGGEPWKQWNPPMRDLLVGLQNKGQQDPALKGSWDPEGAQLLEVAGRTGVTALALLTLEVYYRHLPLNRPELGEMNKDLTKTPKK